MGRKMKFLTWFLSKLCYAIANMAAQRSAYIAKSEGPLVLVVVIGVQTPRSLNALHAEVNALLVQRRGPRDVLVDVRDAGIPSRRSVEISLEFLRTAPFRRMAVFGTQPSLMILVNSMLKLSGGNERLKIFRDETLARQWLEEARHPIRTKLKQKTARFRRQG